MIERRIGLGQLVALSLAGDYVQEARAAQLLQVLQGRHERIEIVAVDGADVVEAEFLEQRAGRQEPLDVLLDAIGEFEQRRGDRQDLFTGAAGGIERVAGEDAGQILVERTHRVRDRHVVVVENDEHVGVGDAGIVHGLKSLSSGHGAIADDGDRAPVFALELGGECHAQRGGDRSRRMADAEGVELAFAALRET